MLVKLPCFFWLYSSAVGKTRHVRSGNSQPQLELFGPTVHLPGELRAQPWNRLQSVWNMGLLVENWAVEHLHVMAIWCLHRFLTIFFNHQILSPSLRQCQATHLMARDGHSREAPLALGVQSSNFKGSPRLRPCQNHTSHGQKWAFRVETSALTHEVMSWMYRDNSTNTNRSLRDKQRLPTPNHTDA